MTDFNAIPAGVDVPNDVNAIIEIPAHSVPVKYEADKKFGILKVDRIMSAGMRYPQNYGFIPGTLARDGDPLDIIVIAPFPLEHLALISCRPVALLNMTDQAGPDEKVIAVPVDQVYPPSQHIQTLKDIDEFTLNQIQFFFENYKKLEPGKWVRLDGWEDRDAAIDAITQAVTAYRAAHQ